MEKKEKKPKKKGERASVQLGKGSNLEAVGDTKKRNSGTEDGLCKKLESMNLNPDYIPVKKLFSHSQAGKSEDGMKKTNQDSLLVMEKLKKSDTFNLFSVMDGHGPNGHLVSQFVVKYVTGKINSNKRLEAAKNEEELYAALKKNNYEIIRHLFTHAEKELIKAGSIDANFSGTTCCMVIQVGNHLISANVGDSRAIMVTKKGLVPLTKDQKPNDELESQRIVKAGGEISQYEEDGEKSGPFRVWQKGQPYPGIAMSRSIGDFIASSLGVISEPVIVEYELTSEVKFIVVASDGVWEFLDNNKVMNMVSPYYDKSDPDSAGKLLIKESTTWWENEDVVIDDITAIVVFY